MSDPLTDEELATFFGLLRRSAEVELDQWEPWRCDTAYGEVFTTIGRYTPVGYDAKLFRPLPHGPS
jgi:hypothetical protein